MKNKQFHFPGCHRQGVEAVEADTSHSFGKHTHEQFGCGLIERGAQKSASGRGIIEAGAGDMITCNPGEVHDGTPIGDDGRSWRMLYMEPAVIAEFYDDIADGKGVSSLEFSTPRLNDRRKAFMFRQLFAVMTRHDLDQSGLLADQSLLLLLRALLRPVASAQVRSVPGSIARIQDLIDDNPSASLNLAELARQANLTRFHFLRCFSQATGMTPHAYIMQRRIHCARRLILGGGSLTEVAAVSGFADQSHMTRLFVRSFGVTPGVYAQAMKSRRRTAISFKTARQT